MSQASADQRAGRAGRMGPGHCYRYSRRRELFNKGQIIIISSTMNSFTSALENMGV